MHRHYKVSGYLIMGSMELSITRYVNGFYNQEVYPIDTMERIERIHQLLITPDNIDFVVPDPIFGPIIYFKNRR